jgi:hypothetical protein
MNELEYRLRAQKYDAWLRIGQVFIKWIVIGFIAWCVEGSIQSLAGKSTLADFSVYLIGDLKANKVISHIITGLFGLCGIGFGMRERRLKRQAIKQSSNRIVELEKRWDPNRTSSGLRIDGRSRPEDEP